MNRFSIIALMVAGSLLVTSQARAQQFSSVAEFVISSSGDGFDFNPYDYDILLAAVLEANLAGPLSDSSAELTVFAPNDAAFIILARDLGYQGISEEGAWNFIQANASDLLSDVLLYHVVGQELTAFDFLIASFRRQSLTTLQGATLRPNFSSIIDNDPDSRNPNLFVPLNVLTGNGYVHTISRVLRPSDL